MATMSFKGHAAGTMRSTEQQKSMLQTIHTSETRRKEASLSTSSQFTKSMKAIRSSSDWSARQPMGSHHDTPRRSAAPTFIGAGIQPHVNMQGVTVLDPHSGIWMKPDKTVPWGMTKAHSSSTFGNDNSFYGIMTRSSICLKRQPHEVVGK